MAEVKGEKLWYIVQTYSGKENAVKDNLIQRITSMDMEGQIFQVIVPEQIVQERKEDGTVKEKVVKLFPGYVFIEMIDNEQSWWVVRNTPQVTGFLGSAGKKTRPVPVPASEMEPILKACGIKKTLEIAYKVGDIVTVIRGNFKDRVGVVESIDIDKMITTISVEMFGRTMSAPVSIDDVEIVK